MTEQIYTNQGWHKNDQIIITGQTEEQTASAENSENESETESDFTNNAPQVSTHNANFENICNQTIFQMDRINYSNNARKQMYWEESVKQKMEKSVQQKCVEVSQTSEDTEKVFMNPKLPRPPPPVIGKVTHHTIELYWDESLVNAMAQTDKSEGRIRVCLQENDRSGDWGNLYSGYAKRHTVSGLDPQTEYKYRLKFMNSAGNSEFSAHVKVSTTKEPLNGEHLHKAIMRRDLELITKTLESGDVKCDVPDKFGFSGLMQASQKGYCDVAETLLKHGADVHAKNDAGKSALMLACFAGQLEIVQLLRKHEAKYNDFDKGGSAPIHWAVDGGNVKLIDWIISDGADVNTKDRGCGWTPLLRCASVGGNRDVALALLMAGADINAQDRDGKTALMIGIINAHQPLVELLLKRNANIKVKNEYGKTAYEMAMAMEKRRIIRTLTEHMEAKGIPTY